MKVAATRQITIAGAGLAGSLLANLLAQRGHRVIVFERDQDPRRNTRLSGRSINLALAERGRHALRQAGLLETVDQFALPMRGRMMHSEWGELTSQAYGASEDEVIWSTHRAQLNRLLLNEAEASGRVEIRFGHAVSSVDWTRNELRFKDQDNAPFEVLFGADGAGSAVRRSMHEVATLGVSEDLLDHGYLELDIPPDPAGGFALAPDRLHIWPRGGFMLIALPNQDHSFTGTLFLPREGDVSFARLNNWEKQRDFCELHFPDALPLFGALRNNFRDRPIGTLGTVRCDRWHVQGQALLLGDAAHAIVPFHGQGMNAAFEDCSALLRLIQAPQTDWATVFHDFEKARKPQANAIADMALENYGTMRAAVRDPVFLLQKKLEHELERRHGDRFIARYSLVMFHRGPYSDAYRRGEIQGQILSELLAGIATLAEVDFDLAARLIHERLEPLPVPVD